MSKRPYFDPEHPNIFPIEEHNGEKYLIHCGVHQQAYPREDEEETEEMLRVRAEILTLCHSFKIKVKNVSTGYCKTCFHELVKELNK